MKKYIIAMLFTLLESEKEKTSRLQEQVEELQVTNELLQAKNRSLQSVLDLYKGGTAPSYTWYPSWSSEPIKWPPDVESGSTGGCPGIRPKMKVS